MSERELLDRARDVRERAYAPYSGFRVGAAIETEDGDVFTGANVENVVLGLSVCAERHAVAAAVAAGKRNFRRLAIVSDGESSVPPCGACRQVLREFAEDLEILLGDAKGGWRSLRLSELLPEAFVCYPKKPGA